MRLGTWEIILIIVVVLLVFGGTRLAGLGKSLGKGVREFKEEIHAEEEKPQEKAEVTETEEQNK